MKTTEHKYSTVNFRACYETEALHCCRSVRRCAWCSKSSLKLSAWCPVLSRITMNYQLNRGQSRRMTPISRAKRLMTIGRLGGRRIKVIRVCPSHVHRYEILHILHWNSLPIDVNSWADSTIVTIVTIVMIQPASRMFPEIDTRNINLCYIAIWTKFKHPWAELSSSVLFGYGNGTLTACQILDHASEKGYLFGRGKTMRHSDLRGFPKRTIEWPEEASGRSLWVWQGELVRIAGSTWCVRCFMNLDCVSLESDKSKV